MPGQQHFDSAAKEVFRREILGRQPLRARAAAMSEKARRQYLGVVKNQQIVRSQQLGKVAKHQVIEAIVTTAEVQQPRSRPVGQTIVEIGNQHKAIMPERADRPLAELYFSFAEIVSCGRIATGTFPARWGPIS